MSFMEYVDHILSTLTGVALYFLIRDWSWVRKNKKKDPPLPPPVQEMVDRLRNQGIPVSITQPFKGGGIGIDRLEPTADFYGSRDPDGDNCPCSNCTARRAMQKKMQVDDELH